MASKPRLWRDLSETTKKRYRRRGVTPSAYNAWNRKTRAEKQELKSLFPTLTGPGAVHARSEQRKNRPLPGSLKDAAYRNILSVLAPHEGRIGSKDRPGVKDGYLKYQPDISHIRARIDAMSHDELVAASVADLDMIRLLASDQSGWRIVNGESINPFWYG